MAKKNPNPKSETPAEPVQVISIPVTDLEELPMPYRREFSDILKRINYNRENAGKKAISPTDT